MNVPTYHDLMTFTDKDLRFLHVQLRDAVLGREADIAVKRATGATTASTLAELGHDLHDLRRAVRTSREILHARRISAYVTATRHVVDAAKNLRADDNDETWAALEQALDTFAAVPREQDLEEALNG